MNPKWLVPVLAFVGLLATTRASAAEPWAKTVAISPVKEFGTVTIPNGTEPVRATLAFPAVPKKDETRVVLRFQSRLHYETPGGWNPYMSLKLNGKLVEGFTDAGTPRVVNRGPEATVNKTGRPYTVPWWGQVQGSEVSLLTFMGPGGKVFDKRVESDRDELYWFVIDVSDLVNYRVMGLDDVVVSDKPNELILSNNLLTTLVKNAKVNLVLDDLCVGYLPVQAWKAKTPAMLTQVEPLGEGLSLKGEGYEVRIAPAGEMHIIRDGQVFAFTSRFSYPGEKSVAFNALDRKPGEGQEAAWKPATASASAVQATVEAQGRHYRIKRTVMLDGPRVRVEDQFTNIGPDAVGVIVRHACASPERFSDPLIGGAPKISVAHSAENPTIFLTAEHARLGIVAEDIVQRLQFGAKIRPNQANWHVEHFGMDKGDAYTFRWTIYPMKKAADYYDFINRLRKDWGVVGHTIRGPWDWFHVQKQASLLDNPEKLRAYLKRKNIKVVNLNPWLGWDNMNIKTGLPTTRAEYKEMMQRAAKVFREVDPDILLQGSIESFPIEFSSEDAQTLAERLKFDGKSRNCQIDPSLFKDLSSVDSDRMDSVLVDRQGKVPVYMMSRGSKKGVRAIIALVAYPAPGNAHHAKLMEQARFMIEEVGLDGLYIDMFGFAFEGQDWIRYDYKRWDGRTVDIDPKTGLITNRYTDAGLVSAPARAELIKYVLKKGKVFTANGYPVVPDEQALPHDRFSESEYEFNPLNIGRGEKPPVVPRMTGGHLSTGIGLGYRPVRLGKQGMEDRARVQMKTAITYLRNSAVMYYYYTEIPATGPGSGEYGPWNNMFPITPIELREGYIIGKERIITAISGKYEWKHASKPEVLVFDVTGRPAQAKIDMQQADGGWTVILGIEDWENIAVISERDGKKGH